MNKQSQRTCPAGESLEQRLLLATDVLALVAPSDATLSSSPENLVQSGSVTYFDARTDLDSGNGTTRRIFRTNGTEAGTFSILSEPARLESSAALDGRFVFVANGALYGTRGNARSTTVLIPATDSQHQHPGGEGVVDIDVFALNNGLAIVMRRFEAGFVDLHSTDGRTVENLELPFANSEPQLLVVKDRRAWFLDHGLVWSTDGVSRFMHGRGPRFVEIGPFAHVDQAAYFEAETVPLERTGSQRGIWRLSTVATDRISTPGLFDSITRVSTMSGISDQIGIGDWLYFTASSEQHGRELWRLHLSFASTPELVFDALPGTASSNPEFLVEYKDQLLFSADGKLFSHKPEENSTRLIRGFEGQPTSFGPRWLTWWNDQVYFVADDGQGEELWSTDATTDGTQLVADIAPGPTSSSPKWLTVQSPSRSTAALFDLHFTAYTPEHGEELWAIDPDGNARLVRDIRQEQNRQAPSISELTEFKDAVYFRFNDGSHGVELWRSDGTESGTSLLKDIFPGERGGSPRDFFVLGDWMYFTANDGEHGYEFWRTDGTSAGTTMVSDLRPGTEGSVPSGFSERNGEVWFGGHDGTLGEEIWKSDGTANGTVLVLDIEQPDKFVFGPVSEIYWTAEFVHFWSGSEARQGISQLLQGEDADRVTRVLDSVFMRPKVVNDFIFFLGWVSGRFGLYKVNGNESAGRLTFLDQSITNEELRFISPLAVFNDEMYYVAIGRGIWKTDGPSDAVRTGLPETAAGLDVSDRHLFAWDAMATSRSLIFAMDADGQVTTLVDEQMTLLDIVADPLGLSFLVRDETSRSDDVWYSDGTAEGTRQIGSVPRSDQPTELTRLGDQVFLISKNADSRDTVWTVPLNVPGDLNGDLHFDGADVDALFAATISGSSEERFDLNDDQEINDADVQVLIEDIAGTRLGDFDLNGRVEFADFLVIAEHFGGEFIGYAAGDANGDREVTFEDFLIMAEAFGFNSRNLPEV